MPVWPAFQGNLGLSRQCAQKPNVNWVGWGGRGQRWELPQRSSLSPLLEISTGKGSWCALPGTAAVAWRARAPGVPCLALGSAGPRWQLWGLCSCHSCRGCVRPSLPAGAASDVLALVQPPGCGFFSFLLWFLKEELELDCNDAFPPHPHPRQLLGMCLS